jgi:hypothetical protein
MEVLLVMNLFNLIEILTFMIAPILFVMIFYFREIDKSL